MSCMLIGTMLNREASPDYLFIYLFFYDACWQIAIARGGIPSTFLNTIYDPLQLILLLTSLNSQ